MKKIYDIFYTVHVLSKKKETAFEENLHLFRDCLTFYQLNIVHKKTKLND